MSDVNRSYIDRGRFTGLAFTQLRAVMLAIFPIVMLAGFVYSSADQGSRQAEAHAALPLATGIPKATSVVLVIDSLAETAATNADLMPNLKKLGSQGVSGPLHSCVANTTASCMMTAFEGRQSPFLPSLYNFSARLSVNPNYFALARESGLRLAALSDHTLIQLYPGTFVAGVSYDEERIAMTERDEFAFNQVRRWLDQRRFDVLVIHIVETDKSAHIYHPGHRIYNQVFRRADAFIGELAARLDLSRDNLVVFGDHGHGLDGNHNRHSWYAAAGPDFARRTVPLDQTSLLFLLAGMNRLPLPQDYEGGLVWKVFKPDAPWLTAWQGEIARGWQMKADAATPAGLRAQQIHASAARDRLPLNNLMRYLPWLAHIVLVGAALSSAWRGRATLPAAYGWYQVAWIGVTVVTGWSWFAWLALGPQIWLSRLNYARIAPFLVGVGVTALSGLLTPWIFETFHDGRGFLLAEQTWFAVMIGVPFLLAFTLQPFGPQMRLAQAFLAVVACTAMLGTPGVYYYSAAQMTHVQLFPWTLGVLLLVSTRTRWRRWPLLLAFLAGTPFMYMRVRGWGWHTMFEQVLNQYDPGFSFAIGMGALVVCWLIWRERRPLLSLAVVTLLVIGGWALHAVFDFEFAQIAGLGLALACLTAGLKILSDEDALPEPLRVAWQVVLVVGITYVVLWSTMNGFFLKNLRFEFALGPIERLVNTEAALAALVGILVVLKYGFLVVAVLIASGLALGLERLTVLAPWIVLACMAKLVGQSVQMATVSFVEASKASDLLIQEMVGMGFMTLALWICLTAVAMTRLALVNRARASA